jgi:DHA1 family inner membrane transport protein
VPLVLIVAGLGMTVGNLVGGALADRSVRRTMYAFFGVMIIALAGLALTAHLLGGLLAGLFLVAAAAAALSPTIQSRLMDVARDSQSIAAALNHSALNIGNAVGAYAGGLAIGAGLGYLAPVWIGLGFSVFGVLLAATTFAIDQVRRRNGVAVPYGTASIRVLGSR